MARSKKVDKEKRKSHACKVQRPCDTYTVLWQLSRVDSSSVSDCDSLNIGTSNSRIQHPRVIVSMKNVSPASEDQIYWIPTTFTYATISFSITNYIYFLPSRRILNIWNKVINIYFKSLIYINNFINNFFK